MNKSLIYNIGQQVFSALRQHLVVCGCLILVSVLVVSCANPGSGPDGGPYDETPPKIMAMSPVLGNTNTKETKVTLTFDEYVKLEKAAEKVIVSPPQIEMPEIKAIGRKISVKLLDTLKQNTTYTIDFSDAIEDNNEGNPMGQFTYFFSTGENVDTMEVSGNVLAAEDLEPIKGVLVGLHRDTTDTAFTTKPFDRVARTNGDGRFTIKGVAPGNYRIYALKDMDGDFKMSRGEMLAFSKDIITPGSFPDTRYDTLWVDTIKYDTIIAVGYTHYTPDDIVLKAFTEKRSDRMLLKTQRDEPEWFRCYFTAPSQHIPTIKGFNFDEKDAFIEQRNETNDTITYWVRDIKSIPQIDTLHFAYTYEAFDDSTMQNILRTDTLELIPRNTMARRLKKKAEELEKWEKKREKRHKKGDFSNETPPVDYLTLDNINTSNMSPITNVKMTFQEPLVSADTSKIHLLLKKDSLEIESPFLFIRDSLNLTKYTLMGEWRPGQKYKLQIDSAAFMGLSGKVNRPAEKSVSIPKMEEFGALFLLLPDVDTSAIVQFMTGGSKVQRNVKVKNGRADFFYIKPGKYYLRLFYDRNGNGKWDTGNYEEGIQPEEVFYFPSAIDIRANWDIEQTWRVNDLPIVEQKPQELIKQKADKKKTPKNRNAERALQKGRH